MKGKEGDSGSTSKDNENSLECNGLFFLLPSQFMRLLRSTLLSEQRINVLAPVSTRQHASPVHMPQHGA